MARLLAQPLPEDAAYVGDLVPRRIVGEPLEVEVVDRVGADGDQRMAGAAIGRRGR